MQNFTHILKLVFLMTQKYPREDNKLFFLQEILIYKKGFCGFLNGILIGKCLRICKRIFRRTFASIVWTKDLINISV